MDTSRIIAHRGLHNAVAPNSAAAVTAAGKAGVAFAEIDVRRTSDGELVLHHDARVDPRHGDLRRIEDTTLAGLRVAKPDADISTLTEAVTAARESGTRLVVEIKAPSYEKHVLDTITAQLPLDAFRVMSFRPDVIRSVEHLNPQVETGLLRRVAPGIGPLRALIGANRHVRAAQLVGADYLAVNVGAATDHLLNAAASAKLPVDVWTVNRKRAMRSLLGDTRVRSVITDHPDLASLLQARSGSSGVSGGSANWGSE